MKYIIELEKIPGTELYKAKGANTLVFDEKGINSILTTPTADIEYQQRYADGYEKGCKDGELHAKTTLYDEYDYKMSYKIGLNDAWECARKLIHPSLGGLSPDDKQEIFGEPESDYVLLHCSASEAIAKVKEYEDRQKWVEEWNRKQAEQLCNKVEENEEKRSCSNCGQPREGGELNRCILFAEGVCHKGHTAWIPKQAKYKYAFEDGHKFCTDNLPNEERLIKLVREHGKVSISLREEQMKGDKE